MFQQFLSIFPILFTSYFLNFIDDQQFYEPSHHRLGLKADGSEIYCTLAGKHFMNGFSSLFVFIGLLLFQKMSLNILWNDFIDDLQATCQLKNTCYFYDYYLNGDIE